MAFDPQQLLDLIPLAVGAFKPGSPHAAAFMQGYQQSAQRLRQEKAQQQQLTRQDQVAQAEIANRIADNQRADQVLQNSMQQQALNRLSAYQNAQQNVTSILTQHPEQVPAETDPLQAQNSLVVQRLQQQQAFGVPAGTPQGPLPNMTQIISSGKKRRAQAVIDKFDKQYGDQAREAETSVRLHEGEFSGMNIQEIRNLTDLPIEPPGPKPKERVPAMPGSLEEFTGATPERRAQILKDRETYQKAGRAPAAAQTIVVQTVDESGKPITKIVPKEAGASYAKPEAPSQALTNRLASAKAVTQTGNDIVGKLSDPRYIATLGPVMGRAGTLRDFIGNPPPEFAELAGQIESFALANMGVHGMRSTYGADEIKKLLDQHHTPESLIATIRGINAFSQHLLENEGGQTPALVPAGGPKPTHRYNPATGQIEALP